MPPITRVNRSRNQVVGFVPLTFIHRGLLIECVLSVPTSLGFTGLEVLVPRGLLLPLRKTVRVLPVNFGFLIPVTQQAKKGVTILVRREE